MNVPKYFYESVCLGTQSSDENSRADLVFVLFFLLFWKFSLQRLANGFSQEYEWQQVPSSLQATF